MNETVNLINTNRIKPTRLAIAVNDLSVPVERLGSKVELLNLYFANEAEARSRIVVYTASARLLPQNSSEAAVNTHSLSVNHCT